MSRDQKCRVLIVEDEAMISMLIEDMVMDFGSEIVGPASKIDQAMALAKEEALDAAILDVNVDGEAVFCVADTLIERSVAVIFATGYGSRGLPDRFRDTPVLAKPFSYADLATTLETALAGSPCDTASA
jgi:DNA-binding NtrC family response regulator